MPQPAAYHIVRLWIELTRELHRVVAPDLQPRFGARAHLLLIAAAVFVGTIERRPLTASKLADFVGMPRPTVINRLRVLERRGAVERRGQVYRTPSRRVALLLRADHRQMSQLIRKTAETMSTRRPS